MFNEWLLEQLKANNWSQADLARATGLSNAAISRYFGGRIPDKEELRRIAHALKLPPEFVFEKAGLLPTKPKENEKIIQMRHLLADPVLTDEDREEILELIKTNEELSRSQATLKADQEKHRRVLSNELTGLRRQLANIADGIAQNGPSQTLNERLAQLEAHRLELESRISALDAQARRPVPNYSSEQFKLMIDRLDQLLPTASKTDLRFILRAFIDRIAVVRDGNTVRGTIFYYYPPPELSPKAHAPESMCLYRALSPGAL